MVLIQYSKPEKKFNKLSLIPYYTVLCYCIICLLQFALTAAGLQGFFGLDEPSALRDLSVPLITINKINLLYLALSF